MSSETQNVIYANMFSKNLVILSRFPRLTLFPLYYRYFTGSCVRRYLLQTFFLTLYELNGFFIAPSIRQRFRENWYWATRRVGVLAVFASQQSMYNFFSYLQELCTLQSRIVVFGHAIVDLETFFTGNLQELWMNYFISGMETRFANFFNWNKVFLVDQRRSPNRRRFHTPLWWNHYKPRGAGMLESRDIGALVLHNHYFRRVVGYPRVFMHSSRVRRDFFIPLPLAAQRLWLFSFVYMIMRIFCYYRARAAASRFFWDTRFAVHANRVSLAFHPNVFKFAFTLHGRHYDKMQLWEYTTFFDSFTSAAPLARALEYEETRYDPKQG